MTRLSAIVPACSMLLAFALPAQLRAADSPAPQKKTVTTVADLPAFTYKVPAQLDTLLTSDAAWAPFAAAMRANLESLLHGYAISDRKTLQSIELDLLQLDLDENRNTAAEGHLARVLELEDKPDAKSFDSQTFPIAVVLSARRASGANAGPAYHAALARAYTTRLATLPDSASVKVAKLRAVYDVAPPDLALTAVKSLTPLSKKNDNALNNELASEVLWMRTLHRQLLPTRQELLPAFTAHLAAHPPADRDIWKERDVVLDGSAALTPVIIGIWDSGVDTSLFPGHLPDSQGGSDNDRGNQETGFVVDAYGIAYDKHFQREAGSLMPVSDVERAEFPRLIEQYHARLDLQTGRDSRQARAYKAHVQTMTPAQMADEGRLMNLFMGYWHGTSVANFAIAGNPVARIRYVRMTWDRETIGTPTMVYDAAWAQGFARSVQDTVAYFKAHGVRVVNMSWGVTAEEIADNLRRAGVVKDESERKRIANQEMQTLRAAMQSAFAGAPDILFVVAAGNANNDTSFHQSLPDTVDVPNLLSVGAVDKAGAAAGFTSFGKNVSLYAKGVDLEALIPGGEHIVTGGTSFAAPQVVNLAGKLLAKNPELTTAELVELIRDGATVGDDKRLALINPTRSLELLSETPTKWAADPAAQNSVDP